MARPCQLLLSAFPFIPFPFTNARSLMQLVRIFILRPPAVATDARSPLVSFKISLFKVVTESIPFFHISFLRKRSQFQMFNRPLAVFTFDSCFSHGCSVISRRMFQKRKNTLAECNHYQVISLPRYITYIFSRWKNILLFNYYFQQYESDIFF